jgi:hypothetical protein
MLLVDFSSDLLRFDNFTGPGVHPKQLTQFAAFTREASSLFPNSLSDHVAHIKQAMDSEFGSADENYFVMAQTAVTNSSFYIWITDKKVYASLKGINPAHPDWSYLFVKINAPRSSPSYVFVEQGQIGMGITPTIDDYMNRVIDRFETTRTCECRAEAVDNIGTYLNDGLGQAWSTICGRPGVTHSLVYAVSGLWVNKMRHNCEYTFYVHQY